MPKNHNISAVTTRDLWNNWAIAFGALAFVNLCSLFISKSFLPIVLLGLAYIQMVKIKSGNGDNKMSACHLILWAMAIILFWSGIAMFAINLSQSRWFLGGRLAIEEFNPEHPYITSLIIFPISMVVCAYFLIRGQNLNVCRTCHARHGYYPPDGIVATLYFKEGRFQLRLMLILSLALSAIGWAYYHFFYININFNSPDKFFFIGVPLILYIVSDIYMAVHYMTMGEQMIANHPSKALERRDTALRFLVVNEDKILLSQESTGFYDTPAKKTVPYHDEITLTEAADDFTDISGASDFETKYLYSDGGYTLGANVLHYAVFLSEQNANTPKLTGEWCTLDHIDRLMKSGMVAPRLMSEISRIYNITMAWKTYDAAGHRLYPIKNYHPTFRLRDFKKWTVDYSDLHWLDVATNNEDRRFFKLRKFWRSNFHH